MDKPHNEIEWNSMAAVLKRLDKITWNINEARSKGDFPVMVNLLIQYYKEISADLKPEEQKIWEKLKILRNRVAVNTEENMQYNLNQLDEIDLELRMLAKKHGYLTKTKETGTGAMID